MNLNSNMDTSIKIKSKVFYPSHGAGTVIKEKKIEFGGEVKRYYEFSFINKKLTISTPIQNVDKLGIRHVMPYDEITAKIMTLKKNPSIEPNVKDYNELMQKIEGLDLLGEVDSFVRIIQYCNHERAQREVDGRLVPVSISKHFKNSKSNLIGELAVSKDIEYEAAADEFESMTGMERP